MPERDPTEPPPQPPPPGGAAPSLREPQPSMAVWLDQPVSHLRARHALLGPTVGACVMVSVAVTLLGQAGGLVSVDLETLTATRLLPLVLLAGASMVLVGALVTWIELLACAGAVAAEAGRRLSVGEVVRASLTPPMRSAGLVRMLFHAAMATLALSTCGVGLLVWLVALIYVPLAVPIAAREGVGGMAGLLQSISLVSWRPPHGRWYGAADRVVVALHVIAGLAYAVWAIPNVPTIGWLCLALWSMASGGTFDPNTALEALLPPPWLSVPVQAASGAAGVLVTLYTQQLYLDLHAHLRARRDGTDLHAALDRLGAPPDGTGAPAQRPAPGT